MDLLYYSDNVLCFKIDKSTHSLLFGRKYRKIRTEVYRHLRTLFHRLIYEPLVYSFEKWNFFARDNFVIFSLWLSSLGDNGTMNSVTTLGRLSRGHSLHTLTPWFRDCEIACHLLGVCSFIRRVCLRQRELRLVVENRLSIGYCRRRNRWCHQNVTECQTVSCWHRTIQTRTWARFTLLQIGDSIPSESRIASRQK